MTAPDIRAMAFDGSSRWHVLADDDYSRCGRPRGIAPVQRAVMVPVEERCAGACAPWWPRWFGTFPREAVK